MPAQDNARGGIQDPLAQAVELVEMNPHGPPQALAGGLQGIHGRGKQINRQQRILTYRAFSPRTMLPLEVIQ